MVLGVLCSDVEPGRTTDGVVGPTVIPSQTIVKFSCFRSTGESRKGGGNVRGGMDERQ